MKKIFLTLAVVLGFAAANAQTESTGATSQGNWLVELNSNFGSAGVASGSATGIGFTNWEATAPAAIEGVDPVVTKFSEFVIGAEGGYFVADNFAIKGGLGYVNTSSEADVEGAEKTTYDGMSWMLGSKYYVNGKFPLQLALRGTNQAGSLGEDAENPLWLGFQAGYAWFLAENIALEPGLAYNLSLSDYSDGGAFEFKVGFAAFF